MPRPRLSQFSPRKTGLDIVSNTDRRLTGLSVAASSRGSLSYPHPSSPAASSVMRGNRKADTQPEVRIRKELHRLGLRFRKYLAIEAFDIVVKPDVVFPSHRLAVFIDGCFWHSCPLHGTKPQTNSRYWAAKLARNQSRDAKVGERLSAAGWNVVRIWEHVPVDKAAALIQKAMQRGSV
jgi:DNA mismatch endonuclease, patch repair protein